VASHLPFGDYYRSGRTDALVVSGASLRYKRNTLLLSPLLLPSNKDNKRKRSEGGVRTLAENPVCWFRVRMAQIHMNVHKGLITGRQAYCVVCIVVRRINIFDGEMLFDGGDFHDNNSLFDKTKVHSSWPSCSPTLQPLSGIDLECYFPAHSHDEAESPRELRTWIRNRTGRTRDGITQCWLYAGNFRQVVAKSYQHPNVTFHYKNILEFSRSRRTSKISRWFGTSSYSPSDLDVPQSSIRLRCHAADLYFLTVSSLTTALQRQPLTAGTMISQLFVRCARFLGSSASLLCDHARFVQGVQPAYPIRTGCEIPSGWIQHLLAYFWMLAVHSIRR
jgi:hypothetical protein